MTRSAITIEVSGIYPVNRGALLMFEAIRDWAAGAFPDARLAVPVDWGAAERLRHGAWATPGSHDRKGWMRVLERAPWPVREATTFVPARHVDVLLDASGFGYGDVWGVDKLRSRLADRLHRWKAPGRRAVLLPQALGPFTEPGMADAFRRAADGLDLVYVRDRRSMDYVRQVLGPGEANGRVRAAPDFTNLLAPTLPERLAHLRGASLVIPNEKMVAGGDRARREGYLDFLLGAVAALEASGREPVLLLHEGKQDVALVDAINGRRDRALPVVDEASALDTKAVIGAAELIVSSRFHGLVSALSAAVPALACGWSHKYRELMDDYGCPEHAVDMDADAPFEAFIERAEDPAFRERLLARAANEKAKSRRMWSEVEDLVANGRTP